MKIFQTLQINKHPLRFLLTPSHILGFGSYLAAFLLYFIDIRLAFIPLALFILICFIAPFLPGIGFFLPVIHKGNSSKNGVALTFDDGPDPRTTLLLLDLLIKHNVRATFFVTGQNADRYPKLIKNILSNGHSIGNHTFSHDHFIMLKSTRHLHKEVKMAQEIFKKQGFTPLIFRPPVGITNSKLYKILDINGLYCVNYSRRACDAGNRRIKNLSKKILNRIKSNDIIMLHDILPKKESELSMWLNEIDCLITGILSKNLTILPLSEIIEKPVMKFAEKTGFQA
jgi:peptidoglycan/xylan/chitin deacetylase (PgdA/CDA1 family)